MAKIDTGELEASLDDLSREQAKEVANRWFSASQEILYEAGDDLEYDVKKVAQRAFPPKWDETEGAFVFAYEHPAARYLNDGTAPHEIEAKQAEFLAFEWEDAPAEVRDMFEATFPTVFFKKVEHPGTPAIRFLERGRQRAASQFRGGR